MTSCRGPSVFRRGFLASGSNSSAHVFAHSQAQDQGLLLAGHQLADCDCTHSKQAPVERRGLATSLSRGCVFRRGFLALGNNVREQQFGGDASRQVPDQRQDNSTDDFSMTSHGPRPSLSARRASNPRFVDGRACAMWRLRQLSASGFGAARLRARAGSAGLLCPGNAKHKVVSRCSRRCVVTEVRYRSAKRRKRPFSGDAALLGRTAQPPVYKQWIWTPGTSLAAGGGDRPSWCALF